MTDFLKGIICGLFLAPIITCLFGMTVNMVVDLFKQEQEKWDKKRSKKEDEKCQPKE